ncbi:MAG: replicative DNA helicase [Planctomycetes bacterium]|nr:replicative DNA helicase [Planctomycetota bacterium]
MTTIATGSTATPPAARRERTAPQDLDAEMALLGSMMMSRDAVAEVLPIIGRHDSHWFYLPVHQKLFETLVDLYDDPAKAMDLVVVSDELRRRDLYDFVGGQAYMIQLAESFAEWANAEFYARIVRDKGLLRELIRCVGEIADQAYSGIDETRDILDFAERRLFAVTERRVTGQSIALRDVVARLAHQLRDSDGSICTGLPSGFPRLDELTSGFQAGDLVVLAGRPSMGKTALGLALARHAAVVEHRPVVFFSMEMSQDQVAQRLICMHTGIDSQRLRRRMLNDEEMKSLLFACEEFRDAPLLIDDTPGMTALELRAKARRLRQQHNIQAVFVDYLQLMHTPQAENRQVEIAGISRALKGLGRELGIPVITMAQLNRMAEGRQDKRPIMSDLRESGAIEQDADVVLLIHREEYYHPDKEECRGLAELIIAKQRNGPVDTVPLSFNKKLTRFASYSPEPEPESYRQSRDTVPF